MACEDDDPAPAVRRERPARVRLVPPRLGEVEQRTRGEREARGFARGLHEGKRRQFWLVGGNLLLLGVLLGLPWLRGQQRARDAQAAYTAFASCIYGARVAGGLGEFSGEAEYFAAQQLRLDPAWPQRCVRLLEHVAPARALFVLPSVKAAEARVREAVALLRSELRSVADYRPGMRLAERPLRALQLLRATLRAQLEQAGSGDGEAELPLSIASPARLPPAARLPLYAAGDAALTLWGDDHRLRVAALDATGVSYLEVEPGKLLSRARLVRPQLLRGLATSDAGSWLVWATSPARCAARSDGCFGKTTRIAAAPGALLELPPARSLAAHLAGRPDRSLVSTHAGVLLLAAAEQGRVQPQEFAVPVGAAPAAELPVASAARVWSPSVDEAIALGSAGEPLVLGVERGAAGARLLQLSASAALPLAQLAGGASWVTGCADGGRAGFAFGAGGRLLVGELARSAAGWRARLWEESAFAAPRVIDPEAAQRDRVVRLCTPQAALVLARDASDQLTALVCFPAEQRCRQLQVASGVTSFSALPTARGALVAYAGEGAPQIRVRSIELETGRLGPERVPGACWTGHGLCARPSLARLGRRIVLVAPEKTDLRALESPDEGESWSSLPVL